MKFLECWPKHAQKTYYIPIHSIIALEKLIKDHEDDHDYTIVHAQGFDEELRAAGNIDYVRSQICK